MKTEAEMRKHRCCFTGHRPEKLGLPEKQVKAALEKEIRVAIQEDYSVFVSGMARGVDLWAAELVLDLRARGEAVRLICAIPFPGFELRWGYGWQEKYQSVLKKADLARFICDRYSKHCFQERNRWMVDHSSRVIAVYNGMEGGTRNTLEYAESQGVLIRRILCGKGEGKR